MTIKKNTISYIKHEIDLLEKEQGSYMDKYLYSISLSQKAGLKRALKLLELSDDIEENKNIIIEEIAKLEAKTKSIPEPEEALVIYGMVESLNLVLEMLLEKPLILKN
ncbi:MAG: hypothetical protein C0601_03400 [Candidatus Muiribacterium halophilum]|uniref:Uncharacterized protein n=1 Tax=Muiribacterium halophilum TaxID=2053465 RepID=A0A2N5ZJN1_MUIH1|nr:MAG: hypothetical protein C0601_03400 [Candidatus Muirbacterium halophilum]